jgi:hypothetical protein
VLAVPVVGEGGLDLAQGVVLGQVGGRAGRPVLGLVLLDDRDAVLVEQLEDLVDVALNECERYYPAFQFVVWSGEGAREAMEAAMFETAGEA